MLHVFAVIFNCLRVIFSIVTISTCAHCTRHMIALFLSLISSRYTLLVGKPPFETTSLRETYSRIKKGDYQIPKKVSDSARRLITKLLSSEPDRRGTMKDILVDPFLTDGFSPPLPHPLRPKFFFPFSFLSSSPSACVPSMCPLCYLCRLHAEPPADELFAGGPALRHAL